MAAPPESVKWNVTTAMVHFLALLDAQKDAVAIALTAQEKAVAAALTAADRATSKAEAISEQRMAASNEWREAVDSLIKGYVTRAELDGMVRELRELKDRYNVSEGRGRGFSQGWGILMGAGALAVAIYVALRGG